MFLLCFSGLAASRPFLHIQGFSSLEFNLFSPSFGKSFQGSLDVRVCFLVYLMYVTEHFSNF